MGNTSRIKPANVQVIETDPLEAKRKSDGPDAYFPEDRNPKMEASCAYEQRALESEWHHAHLGIKVQEPEPVPDAEVSSASPEGEPENMIKEHAYLAHLQRFSGDDKNMNAKPQDNLSALSRFNNEQAEQDREKQLRMEKQLGHELQPGQRFNPKPPGF